MAERKDLLVSLLIISAALVLPLPASAGAPQLHGQIKVCRDPHTHSTTDKQSVPVPLSVPSSYTGTYTGTCDKFGDHCRSIEVAVTKRGVVGPGWNRCAVLPAVLFESDGKPLKAGEHLLPQWSVTGFDAVVTVTKTFR